MKLRLFLLAGALVLATGTDAAGAAGASAPSGPSAISWQRGLLVEPPELGGGRFGQPGDLVQFRSMPGDSMHDLLVRTGGREIPHVSSFAILPYDSAFTMSRVYLRLVAEPIEPGDEGAAGDLRDRFQLAQRVLEEFPRHPLAEEMRAQLCLLSFEMEDDEGAKAGYPQTRAVVADWLARYPQGARRDELEWLRLQVENEPYEYEGDWAGILQVAGVYRSYLDTHPGSAYADAIGLDIAHKLRMAQESLLESAASTARGTEGRVADPAAADSLARAAAAVQARAEAAYEALLASRDLETRESARVALYNLRHGRRTYMLTPDSDDDW